MRREGALGAVLWGFNGLLAAAIVVSAVFMFLLNPPPKMPDLATPAEASTAEGPSFATRDQIQSASAAVRMPIDNVTPAAPPQSPGGIEQYILVTQVWGGVGAGVNLQGVTGNPQALQGLWVDVGQPVLDTAGNPIPELRDVVLVRVESDAAVFRRGSEPEVRISQSQAAAAAAVAGAGPAAAQLAVNRNLAGRPYNPADYTSEERGPYWLIDPAERDWMLANEQAVMSQIQFAPNPAGEGLSVSSVAAGSVWESRGIRQGDVILRLNQYSVSTPSQVQELRQRIQEENPSQISLLIHRNGRQIVRVFRMKPAGRSG